MEASVYISPHIIPLKPSDSCEAAITFILDAKMALLPVVEQGKLLGYLSAETASENWSKQVKDVFQQSAQHIPAQLNIYDTAKVFLQLNQPCVAVCDENLNYLGAISAADILGFYVNNSANNMPGAIVVLQIMPRDFTLTEISRIAESNQVKIIGVDVKTIDDSSYLDVIIKFNTTEINPLLHAFERFDYKIKSVLNLASNDQDDDQRLNWLIKYINT